MTTITYGEALAKIGVTVPEHLEAEAEVPVISGLQAQGDLLVVPVDSIEAPLTVVPDAGVQVVFGEATGNTHWLHRGFDSPDVRWARVTGGQAIAVLEVPEGQTANLIHTDEHGCNAIGAGRYAIHEKRELRDEIVRVTD